MRLTEKGEFLEYRDRKFTVGERIIAVRDSQYAGLTGTIVEIEWRKGTELYYSVPSIYCDFDPPVMPALEQYIKNGIFETNGEEADLKNLKHIRQETEMVIPFCELVENPRVSEVYIITEHRAEDGKEAIAKTIYLDYATALKSYECMLRKERENGMLPQMKRKGDVINITPYSFEYYPEGRYKEWHYRLDFKPMCVGISESFLNQIGKEYCEKQLRERIREDLPGLDCMQCLSENEAQRIVEHPEFPEELDLRISQEPFITDKYLGILEDIAEEYIQELFPEKAVQKED